MGNRNQIALLAVGGSVLVAVLYVLLGPQDEVDNGAARAAMDAPVDDARIDAELRSTATRRAVDEKPAARKGLAAGVSSVSEVPSPAGEVDRFRGSSLRGRVVMVDGRPLGNVPVHIEELDLHSRSTDDGTFEFRGLDNVEYLLTAGDTEADLGFDILGQDRFRPSGQPFDLVLRASLLRLTAVDANGESVSFKQVSIVYVGPDGQVASGHRWGSSQGWESKDVVVAADATIRAIVRAVTGSYAGLIQTPPDGGAIQTVLTIDSVSLATLELILRGPFGIDDGAMVVVTARNTTRGSSVRQRSPATQQILVPGLLQGRVELDVALELPPIGEGAPAYALVGAPSEVQVSGGGRIPIVLEVVAGGEFMVDLTGDLSGLNPGQLPALVSIEIVPHGETRSLPMKWIGMLSSGGGTINTWVGGEWLADRGLPPGTYGLRIESLLFESYERNFAVLAGRRSIERVQLQRR